MINLQTEYFGAFLADGGWKDQIHREVLQRTCRTCVGEENMLSEDQTVTDFVVLHPREARVDESLHKVIAEAGQTIGGGRQLALVRWKDDTESLVVFPAGDTVPSPQLLMPAYIAGFVAQVTRVGIDLVWRARRDLH